MKPSVNFVKVKAKTINDIMLIVGREFFLETSFEKEKHAVTAGEIVEVCDNLLFERGNVHSVEYDTTQELMPGDKVIFHYTAIKNCLFNKQYEKVGNEYLFFLKYDTIFLAQRGEMTIPVNGWLIVEPIEQVSEAVGRILVPTYLQKKISTTKGRVVYAASPLNGYLFDAGKYGADIDIIATGDEVMFKWMYSRPLQYELHARLDQGKKYYRIQRKDCLAVRKLEHTDTKGHEGC